MTDEKLKQIEEQYEQATRGLPGRYIQCISCGREGRSRATLSHTTHCPWGHIAALLAEVKQLKDSPYCGQCGEPRQDGEDETCLCSVVAAFAGDKIGELLTPTRNCQKGLVESND